jgi:ligand-binding sensor domain-containing protein
MKKLSILLLFSVLFIACNGRPNTAAPADSIKDTKQGQPKLVKTQNMNTDARISNGIQDSDGNLWFGSIGEGLYKYDGNLFVHFSMQQGLNSNIIYSILQDKAGNIWVGTNKGLNCFDKNRFKSIPITLNNNKSFNLNHYNNNNPIIENAVWSMMQDKSGTIWLGTDDGVYLYNGKVFTRFLDNQTLINKDSLKLKGIFSILEAKNGTIWFTECADEGVSSFDGKTLSQIIPYEKIGRTDRIIEDNKSNLWFATAFKGVGRYDGKTFTQNVFHQKNLDGQYNILEDSKGNLWFDTQDGLGYYDGKSFDLFTEKDGIVIKDFIPVLLDKLGNIWFSSKGMKLYKYDGKTFTNYSE